MAILATSTLSNAPLGVNYQLMKGLLSAARKKLPFFNGTLAGSLEKNGSTAAVKWERLENLTATTTPLTEITGAASAFFGRDTVLPTITVRTAAMAKYGQAVLLTEEVDWGQMNLRAARYADLLGANAGESLNKLAEATFSTASSNIRYSTGAVGGGAALTNVSSAITLNDIKWAVNKLNAASAMTFMPVGYGSTNIGSSPIRPAYYGIVHPDVEEDLRSITGFVGVESYGGYTETMPFEIGTVGGVRFCVTEIVPIASDTGVTNASAASLRPGASLINTYTTYIYGREAIGTVGLGNTHATNAYEMYNPRTPPAVELITKGLGQVGTDLFNEVSSVAWKAWYAGTVLNHSWVAKIHTGASKL
jgi:N4-gp56 family major capsid protein